MADGPVTVFQMMKRLGFLFFLLKSSVWFEGHKVKSATSCLIIYDNP